MTDQKYCDCCGHRLEAKEIVIDESGAEICEECAAEFSSDQSGELQRIFWARLDNQHAS